MTVVGLGPSIEDYEREFDPVAPTLDIAFADLRTDGARTNDLRKLARALMIARNETTMTLQEMEDRLA